MERTRKQFSRPVLSFSALLLAGLLLMGAECPPPDGNQNTNGNENTNSNENENTNNNSNDNVDDGVDTSGIPDDNAIGFPSAIVIGSDIPNGKFFVFGDAKNVDGDVDPDYTADLGNNLQGGMTLTSAGSLFAIGGSIFIFDSRDSIEAGTFDRRIHNDFTGLMVAHAMDRENDRLFMGGDSPFGTPFTGHVIQMIENISDGTLDGEVPPTHVFSSPAFATRGINSMAIAPDGRLYVVTRKGAGDAGPLVLVFPEAHELDGDNIQPEHTISFTEYYSDDNDAPGRLIEPVVDADDNLIFIAGRNVGGTSEIGIASIA
ncbi:MAG TPA: hypothetical protein VNT79_04810, partial [Phycisphaerae bacterium]|nr:hypothetical protein [Phycisphaerae bacterium]